MKNIFIKIGALLLLSLGSFSCEKDYGDMHLGPTDDPVAPIPVTVTNADAFERFPVVNVSVAGGGTFSITFEIPAGKGTIKEISKVATGPFSTTINLANLNSTNALTALNSTGTGASRAVTPIAGNGSNTITFTSDLATYQRYRSAQAAAVQGNFGPATLTPSTTATPTEIQYYFRLTLEDGTSLVPLPVRVRVIP
jgi:hypothetical protein